MDLLEIAKKARDEKWSDDKIELNILKRKQEMLVEVIEEIGDMKE